jgi:hypothetical protein
MTTIRHAKVSGAGPAADPSKVGGDDWDADHDLDDVASAGDLTTLSEKVGSGGAAPTEDGAVLLSASDGSSSWQALAPLLNNLVEAAVISAFGNGLYSATVTLSSADLLALDSTPFEVVAAPGAGKYLSVHLVTGYYDYGTSVYDYADGVALCYTDISNTIIADLTDVLTVATADTVINKPPLDTTGTASSVINRPIAMAGTAATTGDGPLALTVWYSEESVPA